MIRPWDTLKPPIKLRDETVAVMAKRGKAEAKVADWLRAWLVKNRMVPQCGYVRPEAGLRGQANAGTRGAVLFAVVLALLAARPASVAAVDPILKGAIDLHIHSGADTAGVGGSSEDDFSLAGKARDAGMRAIVIKPVRFESASRAHLVMKIVPGIEVFGGIILSRAIGLNAYAVEQCALLTGGRCRIVFLATIDSDEQARFFRLRDPGIAVVRDGKVLPELLEVLKVMAKYDMVLHTGHYSPRDILTVIRAAKDLGVKRFVITHALQDPIHMTPDQMREAAQLGAYTEHVILGIFKGPNSHGPPFYKMQGTVSIEDNARAIKALGAQYSVLSTDLGQWWTPTPAQGLKLFITSLRAAGITEAEIDLMSRKNPAKILGLD